MKLPPLLRDSVPAYRLRAKTPDAETKRPARWARPKLAWLLATEIETAARRVKELISDGDHAAMEDSLRFIELQISFMREVHSNVRMHD